LKIILSTEKQQVSVFIITEQEIFSVKLMAWDLFVKKEENLE